MTSENHPNRDLPTAETLFLVTGGGKGITAENAVALADAFGSRFLLLGSSPLREEPGWAEGASGEKELKSRAVQHLQDQGKKGHPREIGRMARRVQSSREIRSTLARISAAGGSAEYLAADLTDREALHRALAPHADQIQGLLHGAGALADKYIGEKKEADFELVYGVKTDGLRHLLDLIPAEQLEFVILFSSVAGFYGNAGQADYSLGNEVLNKYAHYLAGKQPGARVLAVDWGPWDGGMVTPQLKRILTRRDVELIPVEAGTAALVDLLSRKGTPVQVLAGGTLPYPSVSPGPDLETHLIHRRLSLAANPFLKDHVIGGRAVLPTVCAVGWIVSGCEDLYPGYRFYEVSEYRVFKGIIFDDSLAGSHTLELQELEKSSGAVRLKGRIWSRSEDGQRINHYQAVVELRRDRPDPPVFDELNLDRSAPITGEELYQGSTLFHGPVFQGVQEVLNHSPRGITIRCRAPIVSPVAQGQFQVRSFNPYLADIHLQSLLIWSSLYQDVKGLPLTIEGGTQFREVDFDTETFATMQVVQKSKHNLTADVIIHDRQGTIHSRVSRAQITLSKRLDALFADNRIKAGS